MYESESFSIDFLIVMYIFAFGILLINNMLDVKMIDNNYIIGFILFFTVIYIIVILRALLYRNKYNNIQKNGTKVSANIIDFKIETKKSGFGENKQVVYLYKVLVEYNEPKTGKTVVVCSPNLSFDPRSSLGSKQCSVYILDKEVYICDFVPRQKEETNIWYGKIGNQIEKHNQKQFMIFLVCFVVIALIMCFLSFKYGK